jgi:flagellar biosynthesis anti-sigma factor FlgM
MDNLQSINSQSAGTPVPPARTRPRPQQQSSAAEQSSGEVADRVELSEAARAYDAPAQTERVSEQRVQEVRAAIAEGSYLTPEKIDVVVERLFETLAAEQNASEA